MFNLDPAKLLILAVVAVLLLGPDRLPQVARQAGAAWRTFNEFRHRMEAEVRNQVPDLPSSAEIAGLVRSPTALLNKLSTLGDDGEAGANGVAGNVTDTGTESTTLPDGSPIEAAPPSTALSNGSGQTNRNGQHSASAAPTPTRTPTSTPSDAVYGDPGLN